MTFKTLAAAAAIALASATSSFASTLDFNFTFLDSGGTALVTGTVFGLVNDATSAASAVEVTSERFGTWVFDSSNSTFNQNEFSIVAGQLVWTEFWAVIGRGLPELDFDLSLRDGMTYGSFYICDPSAPRCFSDFTPVTFTPVSAVPLPAGGLLLLSGLGGVAALKRRKKRAA